MAQFASHDDRQAAMCRNESQHFIAGWQSDTVSIRIISTTNISSLRDLNPIDYQSVSIHCDDVALTK